MKLSDSGAGRASLLAVLLLAVVAAVVGSASGQGGPQTLNVSTSGDRSERIETIQIGRKAGATTKVAMSIPPRRVGAVHPGDTLQANAEVEVSTTCLEPMPQCVGRSYTYSPFVRGKLVLGSSANAKGDEATFAISGWKKLQCAQDLPNRNHHCVLVLPGASRTIGANQQLPCNQCHVNLLIDTYHGGAKQGQKLVIGTDSDDGTISQDKGRVYAAVFHPGPPPDARVLRSTNPQTRRLPVSGNSPDRRVIFSLRLPSLKAGEQLVIDAKATAKLGGLPYNALVQSQLILSEKPNSIKRSGNSAKVSATEGQVSDLNGFNCTRGRSAHPDPCEIRKAGMLAVIRDARRKTLKGTGPRVPIYLNLVAATKAVYGGERRSGDALRIGKGGYIQAYRYGAELGR